jgi:pimeloyl-ACP methyl ester carboxylesterase
MHQEAIVLAELLAGLGVAAPLLVGHSDGASIALLHAATAPELRGLVLLAPHAFVEERSLAGIRAARDAFVTGDLALRLARHHRDPLRTFRGWNDVWLDLRFRAWDIRAQTSRVVCPVLAVQGENDEYGTMAQLDEIAARVRGPLSQLRLPGCGHSPHRDQPEKVHAAILGFVRGLASSPTSHPLR